ncbi:uncharacterized protein LOC111807384 [Cucurbita pepo subsp. pepo]|uniref:uncharacterized protein LOC111807384 n=1 Tax=Cucurbita pepo subsp. pepo TaxID=3664 RepID=UPI000C9DA083|nr:uncharacterized protein LOC111807384 [Cucurbita pepo subsp. pepo]
MMMEIRHLEGMAETAAVFLLVQILVYLILSKSSHVFSKNTKRSLSFRQVRSLTIRRIMAALSDFPSGTGDPDESRGECGTMFDEGSS